MRTPTLTSMSMWPCLFYVRIPYSIFIHKCRSFFFNAWLWKLPTNRRYQCLRNEYENRCDSVDAHVHCFIHLLDFQCWSSTTKQKKRIIWLIFFDSINAFSVHLHVKWFHVKDIVTESLISSGLSADKASAVVVVVGRGGSGSTGSTSFLPVLRSRSSANMRCVNSILMKREPSTSSSRPSKKAKVCCTSVLSIIGWYLLSDVVILLLLSFFSSSLDWPESALLSDCDDRRESFITSLSVLSSCSRKKIQTSNERRNQSIYFVLIGTTSTTTATSRWPAPRATHPSPLITTFLKKVSAFVSWQYDILLIFAEESVNTTGGVNGSPEVLHHVDEDELRAQEMKGEDDDEEEGKNIIHRNPV